MSRLKQLGLDNLHLIDQGKLLRQWNRVLARLLENISDFPVRDGKPESREISIRLQLTPRIKKSKKSMETGYGQTEVEVPEIVGLTIKAIVKDKLPIFETGDVECAVEMKNGRIADARFNPANSAAPTQMDFDFLDDELEGLDENDCSEA